LSGAAGYCDDMSRSAVRAPAQEEPVVDAFDDPSDPYYYGFRYAYETSADGSKKMVQVPLTYADLLDPQEDDFIAESTIHYQLIHDLNDMLRHRYRDQPSTAVWSNLKINIVIPGLTTGPGPDVCVVEGVEDRDRQRKSFRFGEEPGTIRLVIEVVSERSREKDTRDLLKIYSRLGVEEYVAVFPEGSYATGPFELKGWRLGKATGRLRPLRPAADGRLHLRATSLVLGTGEDGWGLYLWDAATGERLRTPEEARIDAERRAEEEAAARRAAEAELERLRARMRSGG
jgi:Putative restriction endonuclease